MVRIGEQREIEAVFPGEFGLALLVENTDPQHMRLARLEAREVVPEGARFGGAPGCVVLWIEVDDDGSPRVVRQLVRLAILIFQRERGCLLAGFDHRFP
jgi:hypothetical protein